MLARVRAAKLKLTPQRLAIVRELASDPTHPTAQELFERLLPSMPTMSFATVYNTLDTLAVAGLCSPRALARGPARFDPNMAPHDHVVCETCGLVRDVPAVAEPGSSTPAASFDGAPRGASSRDGGVSAERAPAKIAGFSVRAVETIYRGVCDACARRAARTPGARHKARA